MAMELGECHSRQASRRRENAARERSFRACGSWQGRERPERQETRKRRAARSGLVGLRPPRGELFLPPPHPWQPTAAPWWACQVTRATTRPEGSSPLTKPTTTVKHQELQRHPFTGGRFPSETVAAFDRNRWPHSSDSAHSW